MTPAQELERGRLARLVLDNAVYIEAFAKVDAAILAKWRASTDPAERERLHAKQQALHEAHCELRTCMQTGELQAEQQRRNRASDDRVRAIRG